MCCWGKWRSSTQVAGSRDDNKRRGGVVQQSAHAVQKRGENVEPKRAVYAGLSWLQERHIALHEASHGLRKARLPESEDQKRKADGAAGEKGDRQIQGKQALSLSCVCRIHH